VVSNVRLASLTWRSKVRAALTDRKQLKHSLSPSPYVQ
jgi:hypothetical protein